MIGNALLKTLEIAKTHKHVNTTLATRKKAVLLTAQAQDLISDEKTDQTDKALGFVIEAHKLAPDLIPAAAIAGQLLASKGAIQRASKILTRTWKQNPHPDLARIFAFVRPGDSPKDRLQRVKALAKLTPQNIEGTIAVALSAIEAKDWHNARTTLEPILNENPSARVCALMARIEGEQYGNKGLVREWLARALRAPKDPVWIADGYISKHWQPTSPITQILDRFEWRTPPESHSQTENHLMNRNDISPLELITGDLLGKTHNIPSTEMLKEDDPSEKTNTKEVEIETSNIKTVETPVSAPISSQEKQGKTNNPEKTLSVKASNISQQNLKQESKKPKPKKSSTQTNLTSQKTPEKTSEKRSEKTPETIKASKTASSQDKPAYQKRKLSEESKTEIRSKPQEKAAAEAEKINIFVSSRAPDDPGPGPLDPDEDPQYASYERFRKI